MRIHDVASGAFQGAGAIALKEAAQVSIRDHAEELAGGTPVWAEDGSHTEFLARHLVDDLRHWGSGGNLGQGVASVHEIADAGEAFAEAACRVQFGEVFGLPSAAAAYFEREGIAQGEHYGGGGGGGEVKRAGFGVDAGVEHDITRLREGGSGAAAEGDDLISEAFEEREEAKKLLGLAAGGEGEDGVTVGEHTEIAVDGFGRMEEVCSCAGGAKCGGDLASDDAAFADPRDDDATLSLRGFEEKIDGLGERYKHGAVETQGERVQGCGLNAHEV